MADITLTQAEADFLIRLEKHKVDNSAWNYSGLSSSLEIPLISHDKKEPFILDLYRSGIALKGTYQNRSRKIIILARLDFGGQPHRNPDDTEIPSPHLHLYREGFADKWAFPVPSDQFYDITDLWQTLLDFMRYCNITDPPKIDRGLWT